MKNIINRAFMAKKKRIYSLPQTEVVALKGNMWVMDTTSIPLPPDVGAGAPKKRTQVF